MRVITGSARGRKLLAPEGLHTRPTSEMCKEAMFSILNFELEQAFVLDLFAGSGQLGIEAMSRGARYAVFVDSSKEAQEIIRENLKTTGFSSDSRVVAADSLDYLRTTRDHIDIALLDPPYEKGLIEKALPLLSAKMNPAGIIVCETEKAEELPEDAGNGFVQFRTYHYGKAKLTTYRRKESIQ